MGEEIKKIHVTKLDGTEVTLSGHEHIDVGTCIVDFERFNLDPSKVMKHGIPSAKLALPDDDIAELILSLEKTHSGDYSVQLYTDPYVARTELYDSKTDLGPKAPEDEHKRQGTMVYHTLLNILEQGNFRVHFFYGGAMGLEELAEKSDESKREIKADSRYEQMMTM